MRALANYERIEQVLEKKNQIFCSPEKKSTASLRLAYLLMTGSVNNSHFPFSKINQNNRKKNYSPHKRKQMKISKAPVSAFFLHPSANLPKAYIACKLIKQKLRTLLIANNSLNHHEGVATASFSSVKNGMGFVGAGNRPMLSTLSICFGGGLAGFGNNLPFFSNHSGLTNACKPNLL